MSIHHSAVRAACALLIGALVVLLLESCLMTLGAPVIRPVEPGTWTLEGGVGPAGYTANAAAGTTGSKAGGLGYAYVGRALGKHFELGATCYTYPLSGSQVGALFIPFKWDPLPHESPLHVILFGGPVFYTGNTLGGGTLALGTGLSWQIVDPLEAYIGVSTTVADPSLFTTVTGLRLDFSPRFSLGAAFMYTDPGLVALSLSVTTWLGGKGRQK